MQFEAKFAWHVLKQVNYSDFKHSKKNFCELKYKTTECLPASSSNLGT
jgi:hypothetical protein